MTEDQAEPDPAVGAFFREPPSTKALQSSQGPGVPGFAFYTKQRQTHY